ncbi:PQQ-binding-like beta-propeller repeat protein [Streptomyces sp. LP05-1]|uniref:PQQ-binding-like beta-propeller repeat protein n=1 Tax=Streptomyces pyxinae TaxID=2970734 RepID=A0ABT2CR11_9ACTN|nr:PQQ-binding-like beta-propeller repeat protein [Streptomyces sp. LP05-1]MCS0639880.1 PQQ-binding-like beta-propeller repeat protein [Streptomyces sp. LP05-1]
MSQPPSQQPPQGGFGAPQDPRAPHEQQHQQQKPGAPEQAPGAPGQSPQAPAPQPPAPGAPAPQAPAPGAPGAVPPPPAAPPAQPPAAAPAVPPPPAQSPAAPPVPPGPPAGAPQQPPAAPPAGAPPVPPQAPGYGYPQQGYGQTASGPYGSQPGPYGTQPAGYGQQPGPYGQAPGPYGQQPGPYGGHPGGPQYPGGAQYPGAPVPPPPGGRGGNPFKGKPGLIIAAATAALLVVAGGTWLAVSGGGDEPGPAVAKGSSAAPGPSDSASVDEGDGKGTGRDAGDDLNDGRRPGEAKIDWMTVNDVDLPRNGSDVYGPWIVGDTVVKAMYRGIAGFGTADGKKKWELPYSTNVCAAPVNTAADGSLVLGLEDGTGDRARCSVLQKIDLKTGKAGWKASVPKAFGFSSLSEITLAISGTTVTAAGTNNSYGFSLATGKQIFGKREEGCQPYAFAGGPKLIAAASCRTSDYNVPQQELSQVDPATGKPQWSYKLKAGWEVDKVYSVSPLVVSIKHREQQKWSILAFTDKGTVRSQIQGGTDKFRAQCGGGFVVLGQNLQGCTGVAADAGTFYMATEPTQLTRGTNDVVAFDLDTGKPKWRSAAGPERTMVPLRMEGGNVLVYFEGAWDKGGGVGTIAPTGGAPKVLLQHPVKAAGIERDMQSPKYLYDNGRFIIVAGRISAQNDEAEKQERSMIAFGK